MPKTILGETFYNLKESAELLGVAYITIKEWRKKGWISGMKWGRDILLSEDYLEKLKREGVGPHGRIR